MNFYILKKNDYTADYYPTGMEWIQGTIMNLSEAPRCPQCQQYVERKKWLPPYQIELEMPSPVFGNIALSGGGSEIIVDDYFKSNFEQTDMTGLKFIGQAEIEKISCCAGMKKKSPGEPPRYYVAIIKWGCAAIDHKKSGSVFELNTEPTCVYCRLGGIMRYPHIVIDENTWDGTDIFLARGTGSKITVSQRFKDWWDFCNFNNCKLVPAEEDHWDGYPGISSPEELEYKSIHGWDTP